MTIQTMESAALAYAGKLDKWLSTGPEDDVHDALVFGVGDLCGGLSERGFRADLQREIDQYERSQVRALGPWAAHSSREAAAGNWLDAARAAMERFEVKEAA
jgi:hypothetical protein